MSSIMQQIYEAIQSYENIVILRHEKPDPDALGSQGGLAALIRHNQPAKHIVMQGEDEPGLSFLVSMSEEKAALPEESLYIICDTANRERIDGTGWDKAGQMAKIDHHPEVDVYGDPSWVDTKSSSTCEMMMSFALWLKEEKGWEIPAEAARLFYAGIIGDTGRFQHSNTTPITLQMAAEALKYPIDPASLFAGFYSSEETLVRLKGKVLSDFELSANGVGVMYLTQSLLKEYNVTINGSSALMNVFADVESIKAWVFFVENEDGSYRVRLRSKRIVINELAARHNGGGHPNASGAKAEDLAETKEIIEELNSLCEEQQA